MKGKSIKSLKFSDYKKVTVPTEKMNGWWGFNHGAQKKLGKQIGKSLKKNEYARADKLPPNANKKTLGRHEIIESHVIQNFGYGYKSGHKIASYLEDKPKGQINKYLAKLKPKSKK